MNIGTGIFFPLCALPFSILIICAFFSKKHIDTIENKLFGRLLIINFFGLVIELLCTFASMIYNQYEFLSKFILKSYLVYIITFVILFSIYIYLISYKKEILNKFNKKSKYVLFLIYIICVIIIYALPIKLILKNGFAIRYTIGPSVDFAYFVSAVCLVIMVYCMIKNYKELKSKKYLPLYVYLFFGTFLTLIQMIHPEWLLMTYVETFITIVMYFTIENPDVKLINQLEIAKEEANKANRAKTEFLSSMSHEIRTPLNAIVGFSDCVMSSDNLDEAKSNAKDIVVASDTLLEIVNGILDISKIEAGKLEIVNSSYDANLLFDSLAKLIRPKAEEKGLDLQVYIAPDLPKVLYGDHANIKKIITNLLSNAVKYTKEGFIKYEVNCINQNNHSKIIVSVEDSGEGIKKENIDKLFTKFQRLEEERSNTIEGTGLGLAITKQLIELMGGKIIVQSVFGKGSKFTVMLDQKIGNEKDVEKKSTKPNLGNLDLSKCNILVVDDNKLNLKVATKLLNRYKANVKCLDSGFACLEEISKNKKYDIILLDDMMPKMSGVKTLKKLKEIPNFTIPVVALTANAISGMREKYLQDGFDEYLAKPIEQEELTRVLSELVFNETEPQQELLTETKPQENKTSFNKEQYLKDNGIDITKALEFLGDMEMYDDTLTDYLKEIDNKVTDLKSYKDKKDMENYSILVHSMKSDAKYLGMMSFADLAYQHELESKQNNYKFVNENFEKLMLELDKNIKILKEYQNNINK